MSFGIVFIQLAGIVESILNIIQLLIILSVAINIFGAPHSNQFVAMIHAVTEPMYRPIRKFTSKIPGPLDWAPMVIIIIVIPMAFTLVPWLRALGQAN